MLAGEEGTFTEVNKFNKINLGEAKDRNAPPKGPTTEKFSGKQMHADPPLLLEDGTRKISGQELSQAQESS